MHGCIHRAVAHLSLREPCLSLWSHDGYRLFDKADILPLVDQDSHIIACDKETFPSDAMSRKRSAADAEDDVSASAASLPRRAHHFARRAVAHANRASCVLQAGSDSELAAPTVKGGAPTKGDAAAKKKQKPSAYNQFMSKQLPLYKAAHPDNNSKDNFAAVAAKWKTDPSNPKNAGKAQAEEELPPLAGTAESLTDSAESLVPAEEKKKKKKKKKMKSTFCRLSSHHCFSASRGVAVALAVAVPATDR